MHFQPDKKVRHFHVPGCRPDCIAGIVANHGQALSNKFRCCFLIRTIKMKHPNCRTFVIIIWLIQLFSNLLHFPQIDTQTLWNLHIGASMVNAKLYRMSFPNFWMNELLHSAALLIDTTLLILVWCTVDKTGNKQSACTKWKIKNSDNLPIALCLYIYIYIYIVIHRQTVSFYQNSSRRTLEAGIETHPTLR